MVKYHDNVSASVDILYTKCKSVDTNPIWVYKKFDQPLGDLCTKDMMLMIITEEQREMLQKFSSDDGKTLWPKWNTILYLNGALIMLLM